MCSADIIDFLHTFFSALVFFHFWPQSTLYCAWRMYAGMIQHQNTTLQQEKTELSLVLCTHGIYLAVLGMYGYKPV